MTGVFIAIEGIDGCGKGTIITRLAAELFNLDKNNHVFLTREPYQRDWLNQYLATMDPARKGMDALPLFVEDRKRHCDIIKTQLALGHIVLTDRYKHSTYAYQMAQGVPFQTIHQLHLGLLVPDLTIFIDISVAEAISRMQSRKTTDAFEHADFLARVRDNYLALEHTLHEPIVIVNGERDRETVYSDVFGIVKKFISQRTSR